MSPSHRRAARRRRHRDAVLGASPGEVAAPSGGGPLRAVAGTVLDASPHLLVLDADGGEVRVPMTPATSVRRAGREDPEALRPGRHAVVRPAADGLGADRIWVDILRVTGTILTCRRDAVEVDMGPHRGRAHVVIPPHVLGRVLVRHPRLEPGHLIDVLCVRSPEARTRSPRAARSPPTGPTGRPSPRRPRPCRTSCTERRPGSARGSRRTPGSPTPPSTRRATRAAARKRWADARRCRTSRWAAS
ncbi:hypothetical protein Arub01_30110 [Actinomadura rubrobrunea]|uniref:Uncharacterized protein n=1 Tax=Actinomadura rubrobrunea TaxID=115335 RepID=A0A9W6PXZ3_9ACTN|nr:hypothetical protein Arub01_30110 [Actinomadura rubrobrunea]